MCAVCGKTFIAEILLGKSIQFASVKGLDHDICVHDQCRDVLEQNGPDWHNLPEGPLRQAFDDAEKS